VQHKRSVNKISTAFSLVSIDSVRLENNRLLFQLNEEKKCLVKSGKATSSFWYCQYQALVRMIPSTGTHATKHWYSGYQALVLWLPNTGTKQGACF
ncbi:MAG: hypothetical protein J6I61_02190, partial [Prevotella sp.]|nr:hypothetical protein [Prevotella sp.]